MRKEEIVRFSKASMDAEFARMLKARTLGPEHLETQSHLRRDIRVRVLSTSCHRFSLKMSFRIYVRKYSNLKSKLRLQKSGSLG